jgi:hypothetical protein
MSRGSVVGIATGYELGRRGVGVRVPVGRDFSPLHVVQTGSRAQPAPGALSLGVKRPEDEADHSPPTSAEVKNTWIYTTTPPHVFMA